MSSTPFHPEWAESQSKGGKSRDGVSCRLSDKSSDGRDGVHSLLEAQGWVEMATTPLGTEELALLVPVLSG